MKRVPVLAAVLACWMGGGILMSRTQTPDARLLASFIPVSAGPWLSEADEVYDAETVFDYIDGAGEVYRSYNMRRLVARRFHKDGRPDIVVDAFDMGTAEDAFGVFTHDLDGEDASTGQGSAYKSGLLSFWKDRYFVSVYAEEETPETKALVLDIGRRVAAAIPGTGERPALLALLPPGGLEAGRVRFFHSHAVLNYHFFVAEANILLLGPETDAVLAPYGTARLLVAAYGSPAAAARARDSFAAAYLPEAGEKGVLRTENGRWTAVRSGGELVSVVFDAASEKEALDRLDAVFAQARGRAVR